MSSVTALAMTRALIVERHIPDALKDDFEFLRNLAFKAAMGMDAAREGEIDRDLLGVFACDSDESAGLAEVYELDKHSRRVKGVSR